MRRSLVKFSNPIGKHAGSLSAPIDKHAGNLSAPFSTSAGGGRGRGGGGPSFNFVPGKPISEEDNEERNDSPPITPGAGHGRGVTGTGNKSLPSIASNLGTTNVTPAGRGRGSISNDPDPKKPNIFLKLEQEESPIGNNRVRKPEEPSLPSSLLSVLTGSGRGKPASVAGKSQIKQENRHIRARQPQPPPGDTERGTKVTTPAKRLSPEDALKNAMGILSRGDGTGSGDNGKRMMEDRGGIGGGGRGGRGFRGRGRGRGGREFRGRGRGRGGEERRQDREDDYGGLDLGDDADAEKFAKRIGPDNMNKLVEAFEEMSSTVLPSPYDDAFIDAMHTNYMIECEPEYMMGDFESNPDIDETPPMSLDEVFQKVKPFLMAYENIQSHEEWEEAIKEMKAQVPLMKEIVDYYSGPDRVTAKQQQEELERVAKTLPESTPNSVKRFTDRAVLSLKSNPGWGFDKKCHFMDKLVWEVSQQFK